MADDNKVALPDGVNVVLEMPSPAVANVVHVDAQVVMYNAKFQRLSPSARNPAHVGPTFKVYKTVDGKSELVDSITIFVEDKGNGKFKTKAASIGIVPSSLEVKA